jgi:molybdopterin synthase catalytic subunit
MNISIQFVTGPLPPVSAPFAAADAGACLCFEGIVRPLENGQPLTALDYEAYQPMAERVLRQLSERTVAGHGLLAIAVEHSVGRVPVGACSFRLWVAAPHRQEALRAVTEFMYRLKQDVPIWKTPVLDLRMGSASGAER